MDLQQLQDLYEIQLLKARYFRYVDTKQWERLRDLITEDYEYFTEDGPAPEATRPTFPSAGAFLAHLASVDPARTTVHQGHLPEIEFVDHDTARGVWAVSGSADDPERGVTWYSEGHAHERYQRGADGRWRIATTRSTWLRRYRCPPVPPRLPAGSAGPV